jgi:hypothetical protein
MSRPLVLPSLPPLPPVFELGERLPWPNPASIPITGRGQNRRYATPDGPLPSVTTALKVLGLSTEGLVRWSANLERTACLAACADAYDTQGRDFWNGITFAAHVESHLGKARAHARVNEKAKDIGSAAHEMVRWTLRNTLGADAGIKPALGDESTLAFMAFEDWWGKSGLKPVRSEQPVWDPEWGYAGTIDLVAEHPTEGLGVVDLKTSSGLYDESHLQVAAYVRAGRRHADLKWAKLVRLPKSLDDPLLKTQGVEVRELGDLMPRFGDDRRRRLTYDQLLQAFRHALGAWELLMRETE